MAGNRWRISDELWQKMASRTPQYKINHLFGTHRKRVDNLVAMDAIFYVIMTKLPLSGIKNLPNPINRGRLVVKRSLMIYASGLPFSLAGAAINTHDINWLRNRLLTLQTGLPEKIRLFLGKGYELGWKRNSRAATTSHISRLVKRRPPSVKQQVFKPIAGASLGHIAG